MHVFVCAQECRQETGMGWGLVEIGRCLVVCARELQRVIKMDVEDPHWNACVCACACACACVSACVCLCNSG